MDQSTRINADRVACQESTSSSKGTNLKADFEANTKFPLLDRELGRRLTTKETAAYLGLDEDSVRKHYQALGGIRPTGPRGRILFFEKLIVKAMRRSYALESQEAREDTVDGQSAERRPDQAEAVRDQDSGSDLGSRTAKGKLVRDTHGIFPG